MSRRRKSIKKITPPDSKYNDKIVGKFINIIMKHGKKSTAERILYKAFDFIKTSFQEDPLKIFKQALDKTRPFVEVRSRRIGGANYQIPVEVKLERGIALSFRWIKDAAQNRTENEMYIKLANELIDVSKERGEAVRKKDQMYRMAEANKAFAHYLW